MSSLFGFGFVVVLVVIAWEGLAMATPGENISCNDTTSIIGEVGPNNISFCSKPLQPLQYSEADSRGYTFQWMGSPNQRSSVVLHLKYAPFKREAMCSISVQCLALPNLSHSSSLSPSFLPKQEDCWPSWSSWISWRSPCIKLPDYSQCIAELASDGNFQIRSDRGVEWSSGMEGKGATQISINNGCFIELLDAHNATLWKSSDVHSSPRCSDSFPSFTFRGLPPLLLLAILTILSLP